MSDSLRCAHAAPPGLWRDAGGRAVVAAFAFNGLLLGVWASRVPAFRDAFALDPGALGLLLLALAGGAIASFPLAGALSERWGPDRLTVLCARAYGPALMLIGLVPEVMGTGVAEWGVMALGGALFVFGALHGAMDVAMNGWAARVEARLARPVMSLFHALFSLGAGLGAASGYAAATLGLAPAGHFAAAALPAAAAALTMMTAALSGPALASASGPARPALALPSRALLLVGLVALSTSMGEGAMVDWSAVFLRVALEAGEAQAALGFAAFSVAMVLTRLSGGVMVRRLGPVSATRLSGLVAFAGLAVLIAAQSLAAALAGFALAGVGYAVMMPLAFSRAAADPHTRPGPALAGVATLGYGGMLLGPPAVGFIAEAAGLRASLAALALLALLAAALAPCLRIPDQGAD